MDKLIGRKHTEETKKKMSAARTKYYAEKRLNQLLISVNSN